MSWYGWVGGLVMTISHGMTSSGMFSLINMIYERVHSRSMLMVRGVLKVNPVFSLYWFVLSASNMYSCSSFFEFGCSVVFVFGVLGVDLWFILPLGLMFLLVGLIL